MEFKKSKRYDEGRPKLNVPQRGSESINTHSAKHTKPAEKIVATKQQKRVPLSQVRKVLITRKSIVIAGIGATVIICSLVIGSSMYGHNVTKSPTTADANKIIENLEYQTVLPVGKTINTLGGWKRVSPPDSDPVYAYIDAIDGIAVSVSQQPLPKSFEGDVDSKVAELAKKFNATTKVDASGTTVYIGTSAKGPQSIIFTKNGILILVKSQEKITDASWIKYAKSLS
ncbi:MAG: hypothetical protein ABIQ04_04165 [Candidatus Saccharimonadales bacterium]